MKFNYIKICKELLSDLPQKQREVLEKRFNLKSGASKRSGFKGETLEAIGKNFNITRERVRQIERDGFLRLKPKVKKYEKVFDYFESEIKKMGGLRREDSLLEDLGGKDEKPQVLFLLNLSNQFEKIKETDEFHAFWTINKKSVDLAKKNIDSFLSQFKKGQKALKIKELKTSLSDSIKASFLEISKKIQKNQEDLYGLKEWPEINPKGVKDKAYFVLKKNGKPLHFVDVSHSIKASFACNNGSPNVQTVHNELIKDSRFVLVGRGVYALKEWGYTPGYVKDVIAQLIKSEGKPLAKDDIVKKVSDQRFVKENTILLNLSNRKYFSRNSDGRYYIRES